MQIARFMTHTDVEGPGTRSALWLQGCSIRCAHCCNQQMLDFEAGTKVSPQELAIEASKLPNEGISILGGEPLDQAHELKIFLQEFKQRCHQTVMLFTGYEWSCIAAEPSRASVVALCDLVIAGPFIKELSPDSRRWIGSKNQTIHFISSKYAKLKENWDKYRQEVDICVEDGRILINGSVIDSDHELARIFAPGGEK